jgi:FkbM family methyltransferase
MLRHVGCLLPIEFWYQGVEEMDGQMVSLISGLGVKCVNATEVEKRCPRRVIGGWELKSYAMLHSAFEEVLLLDADNVPIRDPSYLFDAQAYQQTGSVFWPDYGSLGPQKEIWSICDVAYRPEPEFETGQILVHKRRCWRALHLAFWFNDHSDFFYQYIHGDKETFHLAWRKLEQAYTMVSTPIQSLDGIMCQHDLSGQRLFQHRNTHKWKAFARNKQVPGFHYEAECLRFLRQLEHHWNGKIHVDLESLVREDGFALRGGTADPNIFHMVFEKNEYDLPERFRADEVVIDVGAHIGSFSYACLKRGARRVLAFEPERENFRLAKYNLQEFGKRVQLYQKAVWRSDRHPTALMHSGYEQSDGGVNTGGGTVLVQAQESPRHQRKELVGSIGLDQVLKRFRAVHLLKLDCEGSEWPILFTSKLLERVHRICGEYHELERIPTPAQVPGFEQYGRKELEAFLRSRYKTVRIQSQGTSRLGHFWAEGPIQS